MSRQNVLGSNHIEDVSWLCSLSESELDLLINLKMMVCHRAKLSNHESLAKKFDLKTFRALGLIFMEHFREKISDMPDTPVLADICASLDRSNLLKQNSNDDSGCMSIEELRALIGTARRRKRAAELYGEEFHDPKRRAEGG